MGWDDFGRWLMSPGFGGAAAVLAASLALWGAQAGRRSADRRAREERWWEQARWAADLLLQDEDRQALGIAALAQLVEEAPDVEAALFARVALEPIVFPGEEVELVDGSQADEAQSSYDETRDRGGREENA